MTKHTPGPWQLCNRIITSNSIMIGEKINMIEHREGQTGWNVAVPMGASKEEVKANSRLIAAAPDLLEVAKWAYQYLQNVEEVGKAYGASMNNERMGKLRIVIAKAEGN